MQVGHCCPGGPNTLCVEHLKAQTQLENLAEENERRAAKVEQSNAERQYWLMVQLGFEPAPPVQHIDEDEVPFYSMPTWFAAFQPQPDKTAVPF